MNASHRSPKKKPRQVAKIDAHRCTGCGACVEVCPVDCIAYRREASGPHVRRWCEIDGDRCTGCALCIRLPARRPDGYRLQICPWGAVHLTGPRRPRH